MFAGSIYSTADNPTWTKVITGMPVPQNIGHNIFSTIRDAGQSEEKDIKIYISKDDGSMFASKSKKDTYIDFFITYICK